jgi:predicted GNAT superfamily acetyltransferase
MYGGNGFGAYSGDATDRFIVDWPLDADPPKRVPIPALPRPQHAAMCVEDHDDLLITVPARWDSLRIEVGPAQASTLRDGLRRVVLHALGTGRVGVSCQTVDEDTAFYRFSRPVMPTEAR